MYVYIAKDKELSCRNNSCLIYLKHNQQCLTHHLPTQKLIISITIKRGKQTRASTGIDKRYSVIFTCLTYRVVQLELAGDLSTDCFMIALQRFTSRRGNPRSMWSKNGRNFVIANLELKSLLKA